MWNASPVESQDRQIAPLTLRLLAIAVDVVILFVINIILANLMDAAGLISLDELQEQEEAFAVPDVNLVAAWMVSTALYYICFVIVRSATPGKMAAGIYIADRDGRPVTPDTAILRYLVYLVGGAVAVGTIASLVLLFTDPQRRTVHDRIARTMVLRRPRDETE